MKKTEIAVKRMITIMLVGALLLGTELSGVFAEDVPAGAPDITESEESIEETAEPEEEEPDSGAAGAEETEPEPEPEEQAADEPAQETERNVREQQSTDAQAEADSDENMIGGVIWLDEDEDGIIDPEEPVIADFPVSLYQDDQLIATTETAADGSYQFENLDPGEYTVRIQTEIIDETEYLLPLAGITGDNAFQPGEDGENAYTDPVEIEGDTIVTDLNAGMRQVMDITPYSSGSYKVTGDTSGDGYGTFPDLEDAVQACVTTEPCTITAGANDELTSRIDIEAGQEITLTSDAGGPYTIIQNATDTSDSNARHFNVKKDGGLTLKNIVLSGTGLDSGSEYNGGVSVGNATFIMLEGSVITKCYGNSGGGVNVSSTNSGSSFTLDGGEISGNTARTYGGGLYMGYGEAEMISGKISNNTSQTYGGGVYQLIMTEFTMNGGEISGNTAEYGAGLYGLGGFWRGADAEFFMNDGKIIDNTGTGVYMDGAFFTMTDGKISGNTAAGVAVLYGGGFEMIYGEISNNSSNNGGGVYILDSSFKMEDGLITNNRARSVGGGVYIVEGSFEMTDGEISNNTCFMAGGGVYVYQNSVFEMKDGKIDGNEADGYEERYHSGAGYGGGVYVDYSCSLDVQAGEITNNSAYANGGGIYTGDNQYGDPDPATGYTNITIDQSVVFAGNTSTRPCDPPANYASFTRFDGSLLNDDDINYQGYYTIYFYANNDTSESHKQETTTWTGSTDVTLDAYSDMLFTAPDGYVFAGWNTAPDGSGDSYTDKQQYVTLKESLTLYAVWERVVSYTVDVEYYYLDADGNPVQMSAAGTTVIEGEMVTIDITSAYIPTNYTAWYYTVGPDHDVNYYFEDAGDEYGGIYADTTIRVYAVSTLIDVVLPGDSFFWYANEDTSTIVDWLLNPVTGQVTTLSGSDVVYEIRSKAYTIQNNGLTPVTVELADFEQDGSRSEIEDLLDNSAGDMLFLNLTGDLAEEPPLGQDLLLQESTTADPFGVYSESLGAGESWQYSFGGFYYPDAGHLPGTSAVSDYKLTFSLAPDLSDPDL